MVDDVSVVDDEATISVGTVDGGARIIRAGALLDP